MNTLDRQKEYWHLAKDVCQDNGIPPYTLIHRAPEASFQDVTIPNTARTNRISRGPGPKINPANLTSIPLPPGTQYSVWLIFRGQELRSGDADAGDTFAFGEQVGRAMAQIAALTADTKELIVVADQDLIVQSVTGFMYKIENPVLDPSLAYFTGWAVQQK